MHGHLCHLKGCAFNCELRVITPFKSESDIIRKVTKM